MRRNCRTRGEGAGLKALPLQDACKHNADGLIEWGASSDAKTPEAAKGPAGAWPLP
jgi:hypothetical protein